MGLAEELQRIAEASGPFDLCLDTVTIAEESDPTVDYFSLVHGGGGRLLSPTAKYVTIGGRAADWWKAGA